MPCSPVNPVLVEKLRVIGLDAPAILQVMQEFDGGLIELWACITLAAVKRGAKFKTSPSSYFLKSVQQAAAGNRAPPEWWTKMNEKRPDVQTSHAVEELDTSLKCEPVIAVDSDDLLAARIFAGSIFSMLLWSIYALFNGNESTGIFLFIGFVAALAVCDVNKRLTVFSLSGVIIWGSMVAVFIWGSYGKKATKDMAASTPPAIAPAVPAAPAIAPVVAAAPVVASPPPAIDPEENHRLRVAEEDEANRERRREALKRAEAAFEKFWQASDRNDSLSQFDEDIRCVEALQEVMSLTSPTETEYSERIRLEIGKRRNAAILDCSFGIIDESGDNLAAMRISNEWLQRINKLTLPQEVTESSLRNPVIGLRVDMDIREYNAGVYAAYAALQFALASIYDRKGDYSQACLHVAASETYWQMFENSGGGEDWARELRSHTRELSRMIVNKGIIEGMYVQGRGAQTWMGKVLNIDGGTIRVRVTYVINSGLAPRGFHVGRDVSLRRDEIQPVENLTIGSVGSMLGLPGF